MLILRVSVLQPPPPAAPEAFSNKQAGERNLRTFQFGTFLLQPERQLLLKRGAPLRIGGRALDLLTLLVERAGELVSKQELVSRAWPDTFVEEGNLKVNIAGLRRSLDDSPTVPRFIATVVGRGYRFVAPVDVMAHPADADGWVPPVAGRHLASHPISFGRSHARPCPRERTLNGHAGLTALDC